MSFIHFLIFDEVKKTYTSERVVYDSFKTFYFLSVINVYIVSEKKKTKRINMVCLVVFTSEAPQVLAFLVFDFLS